MKTPQLRDEELDDFCREVVQMARASEEDINAVINAPFLYSRLRARIAEAQTAAVPTTTRWTWHWRWALAGLAIALLAGLSWRWMSARPEATMVVQQGGAVVAVEGTKRQLAEKGTAETPLPVAKTKTISKPVKTRRAMPVSVMSAIEDAEVATDYLPLTYIASSDDRSGQVVRVELPRSAMVALGLPVNNESKSELVKADVIVGDDGLALAIRFVR